jgi:hypothetical protein
MAADPRFLTRLFALALVIAVVANGGAVYLKRTGLLQQDAYHAYWAFHCHGSWDDPKDPPEGQCERLTSREATVRQGLPALSAPRDGIYSYVYEVTPAERPLKLAKDVLVLGLLAAGLWAAMRVGIGFPSLRKGLPLYVLAAYSILAFLVSAPVNGALVAAAGVRSFLFPFVALTGRWLAGHLAEFAECLGALLVLELCLVPFELYRGIHMFHEWSSWSLASRVVGTLVQPNSLGVFAVAAFAFYWSFAVPRRHPAVFGLVAAALVVFSGSATGIVCVAMAACVLLYQRTSAPLRPLVPLLGLLLLAIGAAMLPTLTGRNDVFDSLTGEGRLGALAAALSDRPLAQVLLGSGLGVNTNLALVLQGLGGQASGPATHGVVPTDSALIGLLIQIGLLGTVCFYALLAWAARRDARARPFYAVLAVCTLTINVTELFPVNVLLGLALAHSVWADAEPAQAPRHGS